jgi:hypothetical protein
MNCYDEHSGVSLAERFISEQNILPLKLRFKCQLVGEFISCTFEKIVIFIHYVHMIVLFYFVVK